MKKRKYKGEEVEKRGKGEIFTVLGGKISFLKKGERWGKNILLGEIYIPAGCHDDLNYKIL